MVIFLYEQAKYSSQQTAFVFCICKRGADYAYKKEYKEGQPMEAEGEKGDQYLFNSQNFLAHRNLTPKSNSYFSGRCPGGKKESFELLLCHQDTWNPLGA